MLHPNEAVGGLYLNPKEEISVTFQKLVFMKIAFNEKGERKKT